MKEISLTQGKIALVDDEDFEELNQYKWHITHYGYARCQSPMINGKQESIFMHRVINGTPKGMETDHIDGDKLDNRRSNLRTVTIQQNQANGSSRKNSSSKYKGVSFHKSTHKWSANIRKDGKLKYIGIFEKEDDAGMAYNKEAIALHGEYAKLNTLPTPPKASE